MEDLDTSMYVYYAIKSVHIYLATRTVAVKRATQVAICGGAVPHIHICTYKHTHAHTYIHSSLVPSPSCPPAENL